MKRIVLMAALMVSFGAQSSFVDGNQLKTWHNEKVRYDSGSRDQLDYFAIGQDFGYVTGVVDALSDIYFCPDSNVTKGQLLDIVGKYLADHPEDRAQPANVLIVSALSKVFPCKK